MLSYRKIQDPDEWEKISDEWNLLLDSSINHVPFLRYEYLRQWWNTCGGGEWNNCELCIITATSGGELVGIAPFFYNPSTNGRTSLMLLGSYEISDYLDFIVKPEYLDEFFSGLFNMISADSGNTWQELDIYNLLDNSPSILALEQAAAQVGWISEREVLQKAPYITLPEDWETYLAGIDKKQRHEIRRKMRRLAESEHEHRWYIVDEEADLQAEIEDFVSLMIFDEDKKKFLKPEMKEHMRDTIVCAFNAGCLHLAFLEIDGQKAAGYLSFIYLNRLWVYNSGLNRKFNEFSPGWVLLGYILQWAIQQKLNEFDFMRGDEDYKYKFGAIDRTVVRVKITRK